MPITNNEVLLKYSNSAATAGSQSGAYNHLGGYMSTTQVASNSLNNLFTDITGVENANSQIDYRCIFIHNSNVTLTLLNTIAYISAEVEGATIIALAADTIGAVPITQTSPQATVTYNTLSAPGSLIFTSPVTYSDTAHPAIVLGNIPAGYCVALWVKRSAGNTTAINNDGFQLRVQGDTAA